MQTDLFALDKDVRLRRFNDSLKRSLNYSLNIPQFLLAGRNWSISVLMTKGFRLIPQPIQVYQIPIKRLLSHDRNFRT